MNIFKHAMKNVITSFEPEFVYLSGKRSIKQCVSGVLLAVC
jgi:hypothetical protein